MEAICLVCSFPQSYFLESSFGCIVQPVGSYFPDRRSTLCPLAWKHGVLSAGPQGPFLNFKCFFQGIHLSFSAKPLSALSERKGTCRTSGGGNGLVFLWYFSGGFGEGLSPLLPPHRNLGRGDRRRGGAGLCNEPVILWPWELPSFSIPSLWVIPVHQPQAPCIMHQTWTGDPFHI